MVLQRISLWICLALFGLSLAAENYATWSYYKDIVVGTKTATPDTSRNNTRVKVPVLIRLNSSNFDFTQPSDSAGKDIRFAKASNGQPLPYQIDHWSEESRVAKIRVLADTVFGNDSSAAYAIRMYWGKNIPGDTAIDSNQYASGSLDFEGDSLASMDTLLIFGEVRTNFPTRIVYSRRRILCGVGVSIAGDTANLSGPAPFQFSADPPLPEGLILDTLTGTVSGKPSHAQGDSAYVLTARNAFGSATDTLWIAVRNPVSAFNYSKKNLALARNDAMTPDLPLITKKENLSLVFHSNAPGLPAGLSLDSNTGIISGTPTVPQAPAKYAITVNNGFPQFSKTDTVQIAVLVPPTLFSYSKNPVIFGVGVSGINDTPTVTGTVFNYTSDTSLPEGLALNSETGILSGTPKIVSTAKNYIITATNIAGSTALSLNIAVVAAPSALTYSANVVTFVKDSSAVRDTPSVTGVLLRYSVSPPLPNGLSLDSLTGVLSGTPIALANTRNYIVTAANAAGSITAPLNITIRAPVIYLSLNGRKTLVAQIAGGSISFRIPDGVKSAELNVMTVWGRPVWKQTVQGLDEEDASLIAWNEASIKTNVLTSGIYVAHLNFFNYRGRPTGSVEKRFYLAPGH